MDKVLYIMRGVPGSGKSTAAKLLVPRGDIYSTDDFWGLNYDFDFNKLHQAHMWNQERVEIGMKHKQKKIAVDNTNTTFKEMKPYIALALKHDYRFEFAESAHPEWKKAIERIRAKDEMGLVESAKFFFGNNKHDVPEEVILKMLKRFILTEDLEPYVKEFTEKYYERYAEQSEDEG